MRENIKDTIDMELHSVKMTDEMRKMNMGF